MAPRKKWVPLNDIAPQTRQTPPSSTPSALLSQYTGNTWERLNRFAPAIHRLAHYGNTQAVILDHYRGHKGSILRFKDEKITLTEVEAGHGHKKWLDEKKRRVKKWTKKLERDDYTSTRPATCLPAWVALRKYRPYGKLYGERKHASNYPSKKSATLRTGFMDLPAELRNRIYRWKFVLDEPVELLPKASECTRRAPHNAENYRWRRYHRIRKSVCSLLRLNKAISREAGSIFYGENEFRFTGYFGWIFLRGFMDTIGPVNTAFLRNVTVHIHWPGMSTEASDAFQRIEDIKEIVDRGTAGSKGPISLIKTFRDTSTSFHECISMFNEAGNLASLKLVLPFKYRVTDIINLPLDLTKFRTPPKITLIHLRRAYDFNDIDGSQLPLKKYKRTYRQDRYAREMKFELLSTWKNPKAYAKKQGWFYEFATYGETGAYPEVDFYGEDPVDELDSEEDD